MSEIKWDTFGVTSNGDTIKRYTLTNRNGLCVKLIDYGATILSILVPDKEGHVDDIVTGYDSVTGYEDNPPYFGCTVGRVANRIHKGCFSVDGHDYKLVVNNGPNHIHGGKIGFNKKIWKSTVEGSRVKMTYSSPDMEEGYPGNLSTVIYFELTSDNDLVISYEATTDKPTLVNLTNHAYFNLAGHKHSTVHDHKVLINADNFTPKNEDGVPTGDIASVDGTPLDLRTPILIGDRIDQFPEDRGFDHNFCINGADKKKFAARAQHEKSGRTVEVYTDQPGVQLYTANYLDGLTGKDGTVYQKQSSFCLETQLFPDAIHHRNFKSPILRPGETYHHNSWFKFSVVKSDV